MPRGAARRTARRRRASRSCRPSASRSCRPLSAQPDNITARGISPRDRRHLLNVRICAERAHDPFLQSLVERACDLGVRRRYPLERTVQVLELDPVVAAGGDAYAAGNVRERSLRSEEHTSELQSHSDLHPFPTRRSSDLAIDVTCSTYVSAPSARMIPSFKALSSEHAISGCDAAIPLNGQSRSSSSTQSSPRAATRTPPETCASAR